MSRTFNHKTHFLPHCHMRAAEGCDVLHRIAEAEPDIHVTKESPKIVLSSTFDMKNSLQVMIMDDASRLTVERVGPVASNKLHVHFIAKSDEGESFILTLIPAPARFLRFECLSLKAEAGLLRWLSSHQQSSSMYDERSKLKELLNDTKADKEDRQSSNVCRDFQKFVPKVIKQGYMTCPDGIEYLLTRRLRGTTISSITETLSQQQRKSVDFQIGQLIHDISTYESPNSRFGRTSAILEPCFGRSDMTLRGTASYHTQGDAYRSWSEAFLSLLESVLRDAEDISISVPYDKIRRHAGRFRHVLDEVTVPRLVILDAGQDLNTLVAAIHPREQQGNEHSLKKRSHSILTSQHNQCTGSPSTISEHGDIDTYRVDKDIRIPDETESETKDADGRDPLSILEVVGLQDWYDSVFGDPVFTSVLSQNGNADIWTGLLCRAKSSQTTTNLEKESTQARVRVLLYECYHALVAIVTEYYRMGLDSDDRELPARKRLLQALTKLDSIGSCMELRRHNVDLKLPPAKQRRLS